MEELTFGTMIAVFEEMFGRGLFWALVVAAVAVTAAYVYVLVGFRICHPHRIGKTHTWGQSKQ